MTKFKKHVEHNKMKTSSILKSQDDNVTVTCILNKILFKLTSDNMTLYEYF